MCTGRGKEGRNQWEINFLVRVYVCVCAGVLMYRQVERVTNKAREDVDEFWKVKHLQKKTWVRVQVGVGR